MITTLTCKVTMLSKVVHSTTNSFSHTNKWRLQFQASPPSSHPKANIFVIDVPWLIDNTSNLLNNSVIGIPPTNYQTKNKYQHNHPPPSLNSLQTNFNLRTQYHYESTPTPSTKHNHLYLLPSSAPSSPYFALKTVYHNPHLSTNILQHHFPNSNIRLPHSPIYRIKTYLTYIKLVDISQINNWFGPYTILIFSI